MSLAEIRCRLLIEREPHDGRWNMAYDEALLEAAANRGETILRIYRWSEPTLSLGWFQKTLPDSLPDTLQRLPCVRRLSGGGAILHHHEWTYSCAIPKQHPFARRTELLYEEIHAALIETFRSHGIPAAMRGESNAAANGEFLCFLRGDARDILLDGYKIVGSAQRRRRGAVLQHGSVVLRGSPLAPDLPGLADLVSDLPQDPLFAAEAFSGILGARMFHGKPDEHPLPDDSQLAQARRESYVIHG